MGDRAAATVLRVLVADDSVPVQEMLAELVAGAGASVVGTTDTEAATIEAIRRLKPDVVVLDLQLKAGSGANVLRTVRSDPEVSSTRLFVTSNHDSAQMRAGCVELGADEYYDKLKELALLAAKIGELAPR